ncbi:hypothetical protein ABKN59_011823 [Abortiporus biennis]
MSQSIIDLSATLNPRPPRASSGRSSRGGGGNDDKNKQPPSFMPTPTRLPLKTYKDKFNALKEKYEQVNSTKLQYERELAVAQDKIKKLENECNLLLDAVDIAAPSQPNIIHYLAHDPVPDEYTLAGGTTGPPVQPLPEPAAPYTENATNGSQNHSRSTTNGHTTHSARHESARP